jgi:hypothetical protein
LVSLGCSTDWFSSVVHASLAKNLVMNYSFAFNLMSPMLFAPTVELFAMAWPSFLGTSLHPTNS